MNHTIVKRLVVFLGVLIFSFFVPWQITAVLVLTAALMFEFPIEYIFLIVGIFNSPIFSLLWIVFVVFGFYIRDKVRIVPFLSS